MDDEQRAERSAGDDQRPRISILVDDARRRVEVLLRGLVTYDDLVDLLAQRRARGVLAYDILVDCGDATTDLTGPQARALAQHRHAQYADALVGRTAVVATRDALYGMLRMYETLAEGGPLLYIARTREAAEAWLAGPAAAP
jgi:hypothetical protein